MNPLFRWLRGTPDPEAKAEAQRISGERNTIKASQQGGLGQLGNFGSVPPTPDVLDPKRN